MDGLGLAASLINKMSNLRKRVMRRVYTIWFAKKTLPIFLIELPLFILFIAKIREMVFWTKVLENAANAAANMSSLTQFIVSTASTRLSVDAILVAVLLVAIFMMRDLFAASRGVVMMINSK